MKYQKELRALQEYIAKFDPAEFSSSVEMVRSFVRTQEYIENAKKLKAKLIRKRQLAATTEMLMTRELNGTEIIITQDEVDALLEKWEELTQL